MHKEWKPDPFSSLSRAPGNEVKDAVANLSFKWLCLNFECIPTTISCWHADADTYIKPHQSTQLCTINACYMHIYFDGGVNQYILQLS